VRSRHASLMTPGFLFGAVILLVGVFLLLRNLGVIPRVDDDVIPPAIVIAFGVANLFTGSLSKRLIAALVTFVGVYWFLDRIGLAPYPFYRIWPVFLILAGLLLLWRALRGRGEGEVTSASTLSEFAMFGGVGRKIGSPDFQGGQVFAIFGGHEIDLTAAGLQRPAVVDVNVIFGGIDIKIPPEWSASVEGVAIFGGYEDSTVQPKVVEGAPAPPVLIVRGFAIFGGVEVKN
jgi:predicted membrane protein